MASKIDLETREMVTGLIKHFKSCLDAFDRDPPFDRQGQLECHQVTIRRRRQLGTVFDALRDEVFLKSLYDTLEKWGIGKRGSTLFSFEVFVNELQSKEKSIAELEDLSIDDRDIGIESTSTRIWKLINSLKIVDNKAKLVSGSKMLHHLLPDLVVPMDRTYTRVFFDWTETYFQDNQSACFATGFKHFVRIAREANPDQYVGEDWHTSRTKVIDNAIVGLKAYTRRLLLTCDPL